MARKLSDTPKSDPAPIGHNSAEIEEANRIQFLSILAKLDDADAKIEEAAAAVSAARKVRKSIIGLAKQADIPEWQLKQRQDEMRRNTAENAQRIAAEARQRRWTGIITPEQMEMHLGGATPQEAMDAEDAKTEGFKAGVRGRAAVIPDGMHVRFHQDFLRGHEAGRAEYLKTLEANVPGKDRLSVREQAAKDFKADNPDAPEPGTPEAARAERAAVRRARESLEAMNGSSVEEVQAASRKLAEENPAFEATEEELAAQEGRPSNDEAVV